MLRTISLSLLSWICVAEDIDVTLPWNSRQLISNLAALRAPLDAQPHDQHLLGQAVQAYVELSFSGIQDLSGQLGPWLGYAEQLAAERVALRQGKKPESFAEAAPELWLLLVEGDTRAVVSGLKEWPAHKTDPQGRALWAAATRDTTLFTDSPPTTALEWFGYLIACQGSKVTPQGISGRLPTGVEPLIVAQVRQEIEVWQDLKIPARSVLADVAWMLNSTQIPESDAKQHLTALITAVGGIAPEGTDRATLVRAAIQAISSYDCQRAEPFIVTWKACHELRSGPKGIMSTDGKHLMVGIGDVASWNLSRLYLASVLQMRGSGLEERYASSVGAQLTSALPGTLLAARAHVGISLDDPLITQQMVDAIAAGLKPDSDLPPALVMYPFEWILTGKSPAANELFRSIVSIVQPADGSGRQRGLQTLIRVSPRVGQRAVMFPMAQRQFERDPYDQELWRIVRESGPSPMLALDDVAPALQRIEPLVDFDKTPIAGSDLAANIAGCWNGFVQIDSEGPIEFGIDSDDGSKLVIGDMVLTNLGDHGMQLASCTHDFRAGWQPLRLDWYNGFGNGGMRLLWRHTRETEFTPIPSNHLSHGADHAPGLSAAYWQVGGTLFTRLNQPTADDLARIEAMPWLWPAYRDVGLAYAKIWKWDKALPLLSAATTHCAYDYAVNRAHLHALAMSSDLLKPGQAEALVHMFRTTTCLSNDFRFAADIAKGLDAAHAEELMGKAFPADYKACCVASWPIARLALARGDWAQAIRQSDALLNNGQSLQGDGFRETRDLMKMEKFILQRITGTEPMWTELQEFTMDNTATPYQRLFARWFTGRDTWDQVVAKIPTTRDGDAVYYLRGLYDVSIGDVLSAQRLMTPMIATHPDWYESHSAAGVLRWCAKQTPESITQMKKAMPLESIARPKAEAQGGVNF